MNLFTMEVNLAKQDARALEESVYDKSHWKWKGNTVITETKERIGLVHIPEQNITAGMSISRGCNATIRFQVMGGGKAKYSVSQSSKDEERLITG